MSTTSFTRIQGKAAKALPTRVQEGEVYDVRTSLRGDVMVQPIGKARCSLADEGSYFVAVNPTPGTGVASLAAADGYLATQALCTIFNTHATNSIVIDYIKLQTTVPGTNGTDLRWDCHLDGIDRWTSGGSAITEKNVKVGGAASSATIYFGAIVAPAASTDVLRLGGGELRSVITVAGDQFIFDFGGEPAQGSGAPQNGTLAAVIRTQVAPAVLQPGDSLVLTLNAASQSVAQSYEFEIGYWER